MNGGSDAGDQGSGGAPFGDIPLFREIQRLLASGGGPVNLEIARQVALAAATQGSQDPDPKPELVRSFQTAVHEAEGLLAGYTRLVPAEPLVSKTLGRAAWATATLEGWKWLLEHLATRLTGELGGIGAAGSEEPGPMQQALGQIAPLMMGIQAGTLVGQLARESLGRYEWPIPRDDDAQLFFVAPNIEQLAADYDFEAEGFHRWLAARDVARHLVMTSVPWLERYLRSLLREVLDALEIDTSDLERQLMDLQTKGPEALGETMGAGMPLPIARTERHRRALERLHAFQATFEGYADLASGAVMESLAGDASRIDEGMARHAVSPSDAEEMLSQILGISMDRALETSGATFCAAVVQLKGMPSLNRVWQAPDNLPTIAEIKDPFVWMDRVLEG